MANPPREPGKSSCWPENIVCTMGPGESIDSSVTYDVGLGVAQAFPIGLSDNPDLEFLDRTARSWCFGKSLVLDSREGEADLTFDDFRSFFLGSVWNLRGARKVSSWPWACNVTCPEPAAGGGGSNLEARAP